MAFQSTNGFYPQAKKRTKSQFLQQSSDTQSTNLKVTDASSKQTLELQQDQDYSFPSHIQVQTQMPQPLTHTKKRHYFFEAEIPKFRSPQNKSVSSIIFDPENKLFSRVILTTKFLREKLGPELFDELKTLYSQPSPNLQVIEKLLGEHASYRKLLEYVFNNHTPSTQYSQKFSNLKEFGF